jgi:hypothetical protein
MSGTPLPHVDTFPAIPAGLVQGKKRKMCPRFEIVQNAGEIVKFNLQTHDARITLRYETIFIPRS